MRLIDADELWNKCKSLKIDTPIDRLFALRRMATWIKEAPTVDAVEQKHGHWIYKQLDNYKKYSVTCSVCGAEYIDNYDGYITAENFNGCPNCLAKMDEEV